MRLPDRGMIFVGAGTSGIETVCVNHELLSIRYADLVKDVRHVMTNRTVTDRQCIGDVLIRQSLAHELDDLLFPFCQRLWPVQRLGLHVDDVVDQARPHRIGLFALWETIGLSKQGLDGREYDERRLNNEDDAIDAEGERLPCAVIVLESAQQHDLTGRGRLPNLFDRAERVSFSFQIKNEDVGSHFCQGRTPRPPAVGMHDQRVSQAALPDFL